MNNTFASVTTFLRAVVIASLISLLIVACSSRGRLMDSKEINQNGVQIRILKYDGVPPLNFGIHDACYVFQSRNHEQAWKEFLRFRHDDPIPIPVEQVQVFGPGKALVYIGWMVAVTLDGGATWKVWNAERDLTSWKCCHFRFIKRISMQPNGYGEMTFNRIDRQSEFPLMTTADYGLHWIPRPTSSP